MWISDLFICVVKIHRQLRKLSKLKKLLLYTEGDGN